MRPFDFLPCTRIIFGDGALSRLGELARERGFSHTLIVSDRGLLGTGLIDRATVLLRQHMGLPSR